MSRKVKRRTIFGTPVKGAVRWLPHSLYLLFVIHEDEAITLRCRAQTSQLGVDLNGNLVDAQYRVLTGDPELEVSNDPEWPVCKYEDLDLFEKKNRTVVNAVKLQKGVSVQEATDVLAPQVEKMYNSATPWGAPAGTQRGDWVFPETGRQKSSSEEISQ